MTDTKKIKTPKSLILIDILVISVALFAVFEYLNYGQQITSKRDTIIQYTGTGYLFVGLVVLYIHLLGVLDQQYFKKRYTKYLNISIAIVALLALFTVPHLFDRAIESKLRTNNYILCGHKVGRSRISESIWYKGNECPRVDDQDLVK